MTLNSLISKRSKNVIGLLSGTSVDGIDAVLVKINGTGSKTRIKVIDFQTFKIPKPIKHSVLRNSDAETARIDEICRLNILLGKMFASAAKSIIMQNRSVRIDLIGSHGQTLHHLPGKSRFLSYSVKSTLQVGDPSVIANLTGITTVGDFRVADCAADGDGAPLVPYLDFVLFRDKKLNRALLNIGGIANITVLPKSCSRNEVIAFDTGPGNMLIDGISIKLFNKQYDRNGIIAEKGSVNKGLLTHLLKDEFYRKEPPKSTGREQYGTEFLLSFLKKAKGIRKNDILRTVTEFTAYSIWYNYMYFIKPKLNINELIVSGGGAKNPVLMQSLRKLMKGMKVKSINSHGIDIDSKEAVLFAVLANECISGNAANMKSVTGSKKDIILGKICQA